MSLPKSGPWDVPVVASKLDLPGEEGGDGFVHGLNVIREKDLEDLSTKTGMPMTALKKVRSLASYF